MIHQLFTMARVGIAAAKVEPNMVLTATREIFLSIMDRNGQMHDYLFAQEGDSIQVNCADIVRPGELFTCTNLDNFGEIASIPTTDLDDPFQEYT